MFSTMLCALILCFDVNFPNLYLFYIQTTLIKYIFGYVQLVVIHFSNCLLLKICSEAMPTVKIILKKEYTDTLFFRF